MTNQSGWVLWPQPDATSRTIEAGAIRALVGFIEQRDARPCAGGRYRPFG